MLKREEKIYECTVHIPGLGGENHDVAVKKKQTVKINSEHKKRENKQSYIKSFFVFLELEKYKEKGGKGQRYP